MEKILISACLLGECDRLRVVEAHAAHDLPFILELSSTPGRCSSSKRTQ